MTRIFWRNNIDIWTMIGCVIGWIAFNMDKKSEGNPFVLKLLMMTFS